MKEDIFTALKQRNEAAVFEVKNKKTFLIPKESIRFKWDPFIWKPKIVIGTAVIEGDYHNLSLEYKDRKEDFEGWYKEFRFDLKNPDEDMIFTVDSETSSRNLKIEWWIETSAPDEYDAALSWVITEKCNLDCEYCIFHAHGVYHTNNEAISAIRIEDLLSTINKTGKKFLITFTGGEPFLVPNFLEACQCISEKHYIGVVSNSVHPDIKKFAETIDPGKVANFLSSLHIKEFKKKNLTQKYIDNVLLLKKKGFNVISTAVAYPPLLSEIVHYREYFTSRGIVFNTAFFIGEYDGKVYPESYTHEEIEKFGLEDRKINKILSRKGMLCNAGYSAFAVWGDGTVIVCYDVPSKRGHIYRNIDFDKYIIKCPSEQCSCPFPDNYKALFNRAINEKAPVKSV